LRLTSHKVKAISRNPDVLPTFLGVVPKAASIYPQLIPMLNADRPHRGVGYALIAGVVGSALVVAGTVPVHPAQAGATVAAAANRAYYQPPPTPDPARPATFITSGQDQPDPFMVFQHGRYYLFTSQGTEPANVPVEVGTHVGDWGPVIDALPQLPAWVGAGFTWAPDVHRFGKGYMLYFTALLKGSSPPTQCIGQATGSRLTGPYVAAPAPFICQLAQGGSIDPRTFVDGNGTPYMTWKSDENSDVNGTSLTNIYSQQLSPDGERLLGQPTRIFGPDAAWQGRIVEAQDLIEVHGTYYMVYSGNWFNQPDYAIGVARCAGPLGPCTDISATPFLASNAQGQGPGEPSLFAGPTGIWLLYTPFYYVRAGVGSLPVFPRPVAMARLGFGQFGPYLAAATGTATG
jgi:hypothetical protein